MNKPFVTLVDRHGPFYISKKLGIKHSTVSIYRSAFTGEGKCGFWKDGKPRATEIPAEWVLVLCRISEFTPHNFRPDIYLPEWRV